MIALTCNTTCDRLRVPLLAVSAGVVVAVAAIIALRLPYVWAGLFTVGLAVAVGSLAARDDRAYWLAIFALALPLEIRKLLIDSDYVREMAAHYGIPIGELPGPVVYLSDLPLFMLLVGWCLRLVFRRETVVFPRSNWLAVLFICWAALSLLNAEVLTYGVFDLLRTVKFYVLFLFIANNLVDRRRLRMLVNCLLLGMLLQGLLCVYQYAAQRTGHVFGDLFGQQDLYSDEAVRRFRQFFTVAPGSEVTRASGTVGPINAQAQYFEFLLPMAFMLGLACARFRQRSWYAAAFLLGSMGLVVTFSRGAVVGIVGGLAAALLLGRRHAVIGRHTFRAGVLAALLGVAVATPRLYDYVMARPQAALARFHLYRVGWEMVREQPLFGVGLNNHIVQQPNYDPQSYLFPTPTHNNYLFIASEVGIPGLALFSAFLLVTVLSALRAARHGDAYVAAVGIGIVGTLVALGLHNLVDHLSYHTNLSLLWLFAGLAVALERLAAVPETDAADEYAPTFRQT